MTDSPGGAVPRRVGVFGGTFDPPHIGHLLVAGDGAEALDLSVVLWIPTGIQPLKGAGSTAAPAGDRRRMVELSIAGDPRFSCEPMELEREGLSFTVDTLEVLRGRDPSAEFFLFLGEDAWRTFQTWRDPARIRELATVAVLARDSGAEPTDGYGHTVVTGKPPITIGTRRIDVSATEIRGRVRAGLPVRGFVTEAVERYIAEKGLYRSR